MAGKSMNVFDVATITELSEIVEAMATDAKVKGVVLTSAKDTFCAGADITMLDAIAHAYAKAQTELGEDGARKRLLEESSKLSRLFRRIETRGKPWVAAINGLALGGGFEICLACHYRVAAENDKTRLGLPEVKIGIFPGAGGTQRVPRIVQTADALQMMLKGDQLKLDRAKALKLVDAIVPQADLVKTAKDWIKAGGKGVAPWDAEGFKLPSGPVYSKAGMQTWPAANAIYRRETYDNYPNARAIMQCVYEGLQLPFDQALRVEQRWFAKILRSDEAKATMRSLFVSMQELNKGARRPKAPPPVKVKTLGVLGGGGFMGAGIGYVSAQAGMNVILIDRDQASADKGKAHADKLISTASQHGRATCCAAARRYLSLITTTADYAALKDCDLVIEAVFEDRKVKAEAFHKAKPRMKPGAVFASNTSTLPITSLAGRVRRYCQWQQ